MTNEMTFEKKRKHLFERSMPILTIMFKVEYFDMHKHIRISAE